MEKEQKAWRDGFEAGTKSVQNQNDKAIRIGNIILDVMYEIFETRKEED